MKNIIFLSTKSFWTRHALTQECWSLDIFQIKSFYNIINLFFIESNISLIMVLIFISLKYIKLLILTITFGTLQTVFLWLSEEISFFLDTNDLFSYISFIERGTRMFRLRVSNLHVVFNKYSINKYENCFHQQWKNVKRFNINYVGRMRSAVWFVISQWIRLHRNGAKSNFSRQRNFGTNTIYN